MKSGDQFLTGEVFRTLVMPEGGMIFTLSLPRPHGQSGCRSGFEASRNFIPGKESDRKKKDIRAELLARLNRQTGA